MVYDRRIQQRPALADVYRARHTIEPYLNRTPLVHNPYLSRLLGCQVYLKLENLQRVRVVIDGTPQKILVCANCIRSGAVDKYKKKVA